jgi:calcineurin-like phosphoesterase family protein
MTIWFWSDPHFEHSNILDYADRPFANVYHMHDELISRYNACVEDTDTVYVLGDVSMGIVERGLRLISALNGHKILISGNHDRCWPGRPEGKEYASEWGEKYLEAGFEVIWNTSPEEPSNYLYLNDPNGWSDLFPQDKTGPLVQISHFPYQDVDRHSDRFSGWLPSPTKEVPWLLHGHTHGKWRQKRYMIDVGVDSHNYYPVSAEEITKLMEAGPQNLPPLRKS